MQSVQFVVLLANSDTGDSHSHLHSYVCCFRVGCKTVGFRHSM